MINVDVRIKLKKENMHFCFENNAKRTVIFGPSGAGKTTLLKTLAGFYRPISGKMVVNNRCFFDSSQKINLPVYTRKIGYLPQESTLFPNMSVKQNILYGVLKDKVAVNKKFENIVTRLQISEKLDSMPLVLSGGQQKRVALARILMMEPDLLLLDEPFSALDLPIKECLTGIVIEVSDEMGIPVVFVTHDIEDSFALGSDLVVIDQGEIIEFGPIEEVYKFPTNHITAKLFNYKNIWKILDVDNNVCAVMNQGANLKIFLALSKRKMSAGDYVCIKPENIKILNGNSNLKEEDKANRFTGLVKAIHPRGSYFRVVLDVSGFVLFVDVQEKALNIPDLDIGKKVDVSLREKNLVVCND